MFGHAVICHSNNNEKVFKHNAMVNMYTRTWLKHTYIV